MGLTSLIDSKCSLSNMKSLQFLNLQISVLIFEISVCIEVYVQLNVNNLENMTCQEYPVSWLTLSLVFAMQFKNISRIKYE
jgi:hypothetical protein